MSSILFQEDLHFPPLSLHILDHRPKITSPGLCYFIYFIFLIPFNDDLKVYYFIEELIAYNLYAPLESKL